LEFLILGFYSLIDSTSVYLSGSLLTLYFCFSFSYTALAFIWFLFLNYFEANSYVPKCLLSFLAVINLNSDPKVSILEEDNAKKNERGRTLSISYKRQTLRNLNSIPLNTIDQQNQCNLCNLCEKCQKVIVFSFILNILYLN
jgi:hypothetical protein